MGVSEGGALSCSSHDDGFTMAVAALMDGKGPEHRCWVADSNGEVGVFSSGSKYRGHHHQPCSAIACVCHHHGFFRSGILFHARSPPQGIFLTIPLVEFFKRFLSFSPFCFPPVPFSGIGRYSLCRLQPLPPVCQ